MRHRTHPYKRIVPQRKHDRKERCAHAALAFNSIMNTAQRLQLRTEVYSKFLGYQSRLSIWCRWTTSPRAGRTGAEDDCTCASAAPAPLCAFCRLLDSYLNLRSGSGALAVDVCARVRLRVSVPGECLGRTGSIRSAHRKEGYRTALQPHPRTCACGAQKRVVNNSHAPP